MEHTYLFTNAVWRAEGVYHNADGTATPLTGRSVVVREGTAWTLTSYMDVASEPPVRYENSYEIRTTVNPAQLDWISHNPALGTLTGSFIALPGIITSSYVVPDSPYSGSEMLMQVDMDTYKMQGVFNRDGEPESWWEGRLIRDDHR